MPPTRRTKTSEDRRTSKTIGSQYNYVLRETTAVTGDDFLRKCKICSKELTIKSPTYVSNVVKHLKKHFVNDSRDIAGSGETGEWLSGQMNRWFAELTEPGILGFLTFREGM